jgi:UDP-N-acetylglucosamine 1-carboxyvinyltransferase
MAAAAVTGSHLTLRQCCASHTAPVFEPLEESGCVIETRDDGNGLQALTIRAPSRLKRLGTVRTMPYPGFPTDAGAPLLVCACVAQGASVFVESIFENRYKYVDELARMGARIRVTGRVAVVDGVSSLQGAQVACTDLRGGAALIVAALVAAGETTVSQLHHLDRGYEDLTNCLRAVGADISRR